MVEISPGSSSIWSLMLTMREQTPLQKMAQRDPDRAQMYEDTQNQLRQTLSSLKNSKTDFAEQRKAAAREKIRRLKEQIKTLRMMAGADPKMIAQQAARLAKELAAAAKDYASAGGTDMMVSSSDKIPTTSTDMSAQNDSGADAEGKAPPEADIVAADTLEDENPEDTKTDPDAGFREKMEAYAQDIMQQESDKQADKDFITEVKKLRDELKNIVRQQRARLEQDDDPQIKRNLNESDDMMREIDKSLETITSNMNTSMPAINIRA